MCLGCGEIDNPNSREIRQQQMKATIIHLQNIGCSMRQIAKQLGFKSPSTVEYYLTRKPKARKTGRISKSRTKSRINFNKRKKKTLS